MDLKKFKRLSDVPRPLFQLIWQDWEEWKTFLEFVSAYFKNRGIQNPLIVEIGVMHNEQRTFYKELLNADFIGLDINVNNEPDIVGDSSKPEVLEKLKSRLAGRKIDLLFIDGSHTYEGVKADYELYGPLVKHLIVFHDVHGITKRCSGVNPLWDEVVEENQYMTLVIHRYNAAVSIEENRFMNMGIGVVIKEDE